MISLQSALQILLDEVAPTRTERVDVSASFGRTLATDLSAMLDQPAEDRSAMDGYAVASGDAEVGRRLQVLGDAYAGKPFSGLVTPGTCVRTATGGVLPEGADAVIIREIVERSGEDITIAGPLSASRFVRTAGSDFRSGDPILAAGTLLNPSGLALVTAAGHSGVNVRRRPRILLLTTGDELRRAGRPLRPGETFDTACVSIPALVELWGGETVVGPILSDDADTCFRQLQEHLNKCDAVVVVGGASVGDRDVARAAVARLGGAILFEKIAVQPGKPSWHARFSKGPLVVGLPGNPVSSFVTAHLLLQPLIKTMLGRRDIGTPGRATLGSDLPASGARDIYWRGRLRTSRDGLLTADADRREDSGLQFALASCDVLIRQDAGSPPLSAGTVVETIPLGR